MGHIFMICDKRKEWTGYPTTLLWYGPSIDAGEGQNVLLVNGTPGRLAIGPGEIPHFAAGNSPGPYLWVNTLSWEEPDSSAHTTNLSYPYDVAPLRSYDHYSVVMQATFPNGLPPDCSEIAFMRDPGFDYGFVYPSAALIIVNAPGGQISYTISADNGRFHLYNQSNVEIPFPQYDTIAGGEDLLPYIPPGCIMRGFIPSTYRGTYI